MNNYDGDWEHRLGQFEISENNQKYILVIGYLKKSNNEASNGIYLRLWDYDENFIAGSWVANLGHKGENIHFLQRISLELLNECIEIAKRAEQMKYFI